jgi:hypothetical protein
MVSVAKFLLLRFFVGNCKCGDIAYTFVTSIYLLKF